MSVVTKGKMLGNTKSLEDQYRASYECRVEECAPQYVRLVNLATNEYVSEPIKNVTLAMDEAKHRPMLIVQEK